MINTENQQDQQPNNFYDTGFIPQNNEQNSNLWTEHLDTTRVIEYIENMLKGFELDDSGIWKASMITVYDEKGKPHEIPEGPLMSITEIRVIMTWFRSLLNSNTFLSKLSQEHINNISYEAVWVLEKVFYKLRFKLPPQIRSILSNTLENAIFIGLNRAGEGRRGMTLDAVSSSHHSIEHLQGQPKKENEDKKFKVFGW